MCPLCLTSENCLSVHSGRGPPGQSPAAGRAPLWACSLAVLGPGSVGRSRMAGSEGRCSWWETESRDSGLGRVPSPESTRPTWPPLSPRPRGKLLGKGLCLALWALLPRRPGWPRPAPPTFPGSETFAGLGWRGVWRRAPPDQGGACFSGAGSRAGPLPASW